MSLLEVRDLCFSIKNHEIIKSVSLNVKPGEIVGLVGDNGAGKSTIMRLIASLIFPKSGSITIASCDLSLKREEALRHVICSIENPGLFPYQTTRDHLQFYGVLYGATKERIREIIDFLELGSYIDKNTNTYSLGMKQRLMLGICLLSSARLYVLDEPTNALDPTYALKYKNKLDEKAKCEQVGILISSHKLNDLESICDRVLFLDQGTIVQEIELASIRERSYRLKVDRCADCVRLLKTMEVEQLNVFEEAIHVVLNNESTLNELLSLLIRHGIDICEITKSTDIIEQAYRRNYI